MRHGTVQTREWIGGYRCMLSPMYSAVHRFIILHAMWSITLHEGHSVGTGPVKLSGHHQFCIAALIMNGHCSCI